MTVAVIVFGGAAIAHASLDLADLLTFLLYIGILIEPIQRFSNFTRLYQEFQNPPPPSVVLFIRYEAFLTLAFFVLHLSKKSVQPSCHREIDVTF